LTAHHVFADSTREYDLKGDNVAKVPPFDIFSVDADGQLVWKETAETVDLARLRIEFLMVADSANYVVFDPLTGETFFTPVLAATTKRAKADVY
jgi:hypothetical protein